jgi:segregation and condensation protein A
MQDKIFELLFEKDDLEWQTMLYELVRTEKMDPWDVDISVIAKKFLDMLKTFKKMDFRIPGKVILAAAILLKMKSSRLVGEDIAELDRLINSSEKTEEEFYEELEHDLAGGVVVDEEKPYLIPRSPQPRKRKVSIYDLVDALNKALEVKHRRILNVIPPAPDVEIPHKDVDISVTIKNVYVQIRDYFTKNKKGRLTFSQLIPSPSKEDKIYTFVPLLHLANQRKIDLEQEIHFGEIDKLLLEREGAKDFEL